MNNRSRRFSAKGLLQQDKNSAITESEAKGAGGLLLRCQQPGLGRGKAGGCAGGTTVSGWSSGQNRAM